MSSENFDQADSGYPEEGPPGAQPADEGEQDGQSAVRKSARTGAGSAGSESDKATGNPNT